MPQAQTYQSEFTGQEMDARFAAVAQLTAALEALTAVVAQKYVKPASGIPSSDMDADVQAALAKANTAVQSLADYYTKSEVDQLLAAINGMDYVDVAALPTASASTLGKIYLVGPDGSGYYSYYYTSYDGSAYSWVGPLGTTQISLANYATKEELSQLDQKVDDLTTGKYYGYYATAASLPEGATVDGFAYVGSGPTYTIYNCVSGVWTSSGVTVNQSPIGNGEDIDQDAEGKLQLAPRVYNSSQPDGLGYKILRKDATFAEQVTDTNTIYEIRYDFDLNNASVTIPAGCVLKFAGGKLKNGTINFNGAAIESDCECFDNITPSALAVIKAEWFGITPESADISTKFNALVASITYSATIVFKPVDYTTASTLTIDKSAATVAGRSLSIIGNPCFYCSNTNTTCISITGLLRSRLVFRAKTDSPATWANNSSIGVLLRNIEHSEINISEVFNFTYGIICRAQGGLLDGGFAWNTLNIAEIKGALQAFVVESVNRGWPNANTVNGGICGALYTAEYNASGAAEPIRTIVFKSDGQYAANGWIFTSLWLESSATSHPSIGGQPYVPIDLCDYMPAGVNNIAFMNMQFTGRFETNNANCLIKVRDKNVQRNILLTGCNILAGVPTALNENGINVTGLIVTVEGYNTHEKKIGSIKFMASDDLVSTTRMAIGKKYYGIQLYGKISETYGQFGYASKGQCYKNFKGGCFSVFRRTLSRFSVHFLDESLNYVDANAALLTPVGYNNTLAIRDPGSSYKPYWSTQDGIGVMSFAVSASSPAAYMVIAAESNGDMEVYQAVDPNYMTSVPETAVCYPLGLYSPDVYASAKTLGQLRAKFNAGDKYLDESGHHYYIFRTAGSVGSVSITVTGESGANTVTADTVNNLLIGDYVTINGQNFQILNIASKVLTLNGTLSAAVTDAPLTLTAPTYTQIDDNFCKYVLCADIDAYNAISPKDSGTLYLIPE